VWTSVALLFSLEPATALATASALAASKVASSQQKIGDELPVESGCATHRTPEVRRITPKWPESKLNFAGV